MQNKEVSHIFFLPSYRKGEVAEGQEGDERHIVGNNHRADEGYNDKKQKKGPQIPRHIHKLSCKDCEKLDVSQGANHRQSEKKAGEGFPVEIAEVTFIGRYQKAGHRRRQSRYEKNKIFLDET